MGNKATCPVHKPNAKRTEAKFKRGFGMKAIDQSKFEDVIGWCRFHDPLYKVKGKERHRLLHG